MPISRCHVVSTCCTCITRAPVRGCCATYWGRRATYTHVATLMRTIGIDALTESRLPAGSIPPRWIQPDLPRGVAIDRTNQVSAMVFGATAALSHMTPL